MDLKFDKMTVETTLAQDYLTQNTTKLSALKKIPDVLTKKSYIEGIYDKLLDLASKIKENTSLLAQLEYVERRIPIEDTTIQINLIIQQIHYVAQQTLRKNYDCLLLYSPAIKHIKFTGNEPLSLLGAIPKELVAAQACYISADNITQAVCYFITKVCQDIGLDVYAEIAGSDSIADQWLMVKMPLGAVGVISELSDIDSAVDVFLTSSTQVPWKLQRILIQESVYEQFKNALTWKCNLNKQGDKSDDTSSNSVEYKGRTFVMDMAGPTDKQSSVLIEAYRTRKELKTLLNAYRPHYLSLWANDIAEINEIAYTVSSPVVWVNNYGDFRGPPKVSEAIYSYVTPIKKITDVNGISELKKSWLALDFEARREILFKVLNFNDFITSEAKHIKNYIQKIENGATGTFVEVGKDYVCLGLNTHSNKLFLMNDDNSIFTTAFFQSVLQGNAFVVRSQLNDQTEQIINIFNKFRVPVVLYTGSFADGDVELCSDSWIDNLVFDITETTKVIWTNSGTIFAN